MTTDNTGNESPPAFLTIERKSVKNPAYTKNTTAIGVLPPGIRRAIYGPLDQNCVRERVLVDGRQGKKHTIGEETREKNKKISQQIGGEFLTSGPRSPGEWDNAHYADGVHITKITSKGTPHLAPKWLTEDEIRERANRRLAEIRTFLSDIPAGIISIPNPTPMTGQSPSQSPSQNPSQNQGQNPSQNHQYLSPVETQKFWTVNDAMDEYIAWASQHKKNWRREMWRYEFWSREIGGMLCCHVTPPVVNDVVQRRLADRETNTIIRMISALYAPLNYSWYNGRFTEKVKRYRLPPGSYRAGQGKRIIHLEGHHIKPLIRKAEERHGPIVGFAFLLLIDTGMRLGEAMRMSWNDLRKDWVYIHRTDNTQGKTVNRRVPTSPRLLEYIRTRKMTAFVNPGTGEIDLDARPLGDLFSNNIHTASRFLNNALRGCVSELGIKLDAPIRIHDLRHTFAYLCGEAGADLADIRDMLGHSRINTTLIYRGFVKNKACDIVKQAMNITIEEDPHD